ncbi:ATP-binding cassette domain-containing protein, partial [Aliarcobacter butzleri]|nr:ATP-binding cassette domain-containing protein [Aliarcobacter butzleri]
MIEARNIYLTYDDNRYIIKKGNFTIKPKEFIFIGGNSGSGKSTLLKSFYGDIPLKHGSLRIENQEVFGIKGKKLRLLRKDIGIIFQDYKLINEYTIEENIMIPLKINGYSHEVSQVQADNLLKHVRLSHRKG